MERRYYPQEFKDKVVAYYHDKHQTGITQTAVARKFRMSPSTLSMWINEEKQSPKEMVFTWQEKLKDELNQVWPVLEPRVEAPKEPSLNANILTDILVELKGIRKLLEPTKTAPRQRIWGRV